MNYRNFSRAAAICILLLLCTILWPAAPLHAASEPSAILTAEEKAFVEGLDELTIGCLCNCDPVLYCNRDGEVRGITRDILELVAQYTGLRFRYSPLPSGQITYDTLCEMQLDLIASVEHNTVNASTSGVLLSEPYLQAAKVIVCRDDTKFNPSGSMSVGVVSGSLTIEKAIHEIYPEFDVFFFDDVEKALAAVNDGTVDGLIQNQYSIDVLMRKPLYENLHVVAAAGIGDLHCLSPVLSETASPDSEEFEEKKLLISIINKGIASLSDAEVTMILLDQTSRRAYKPGIGDFIYQYRYMLAVVLFFAILVVILIIYGGYMRARAKNIELLRQEERLHHFLIEKTEQIIYEIDLSQHTVTSSEFFGKKFGWTPDCLLESLTAAEFVSKWRVHPDDYDSFTAFFTQSVTGHNDSHIIVRLEQQDGSYPWCRISQFLEPEKIGQSLRILGLIRDVNNEVCERMKLAEESRRDPLTGLLGKDAFKQELQARLGKEATRDCLLIFLDLDNFKAVNDTFGHLFGDQVIQQVGGILSAFFPPAYLISRFGGDEFCILSDIPEADALNQQMEQLLKALELHYSSEKGTVDVSASIGVTTAADCGYELDELMRCSDSAMYASKRAGRNCWKRYAPQNR